MTNYKKLPSTALEDRLREIEKNRPIKIDTSLFSISRKRSSKAVEGNFL